MNTSHAWLLAQNGAVFTHWAPDTTRYQTPFFELGRSELWVCYAVDCLETNKKREHTGIRFVPRWKLSTLYRIIGMVLEEGGCSY